MVTFNAPVDTSFLKHFSVIRIHPYTCERVDADTRHVVLHDVFYDGDDPNRTEFFLVYSTADLWSSAFVPTNGVMIPLRDTSCHESSHARDLPHAPRNIVAHIVDRNSLEVMFECPSNAGDHDITEYVVTVYPSRETQRITRCGSVVFPHVFSDDPMDVFATVVAQTPYGASLPGASSMILHRVRRRRALLVFNYPGVLGKDCAQDMRSCLETLGFLVTVMYDVTIERLRAMRDAFLNTLDSNETLWVYYHGHGCMRRNLDYWCLSEEEEVCLETFVLKPFLERNEKMTLLVFSEKCRDILNPHSDEPSLKHWREISSKDEPSNVQWVNVFSCEPGRKSWIAKFWDVFKDCLLKKKAEDIHIVLNDVTRSFECLESMKQIPQYTSRACTPIVLNP